VFRYVPPGAPDINILPTDTGSIWSRSASGTLSDISVPGHVGISGTTQFTGCSLGGVFYVNRETHVPRYLGPTSPTFLAIPAWDSTHRCAVLRSFKDFLVAFNVTKGANLFPTMVKWSDVALAGAPPASWDETDTTKLAGETILAEISGPILDAQVLRDVMVIYGEREVWLMEFVGGQFVFRFRRLFDDGGILNRNCAVEVEGRHYVFGIDDIYVHDGTQRQSIAEGRIRDFVFRNMDLSATTRCFVAHNVTSKEVLFCYVSGDSDAFPGFTGGTGVNRAVVYCYANDTWGIMDMPNVFGPMALAPVSQALTYATVTTTYATQGGSYNDTVGGLRRGLMASVRFLAPAIGDRRLSILDNMEVGSVAQFALDTDLVTPAFLEKEQIDLDSSGAPLTMFKTIDYIVPQVRLTSNIATNFAFGANDLHGVPPQWDPEVVYFPRQDYRVDTRISGRYLAMRITVPTANDFSFSGLDVNVLANGDR
jgi:hypothetical protein